MCCVIFDPKGNDMTPSLCPSTRLRPVRRLVSSLLLLVLLLLPMLAIAQAMPYEAGLGTFRTSMTGPVPFMISLVGIIGCGAMLVFGGEISGFLRTMVFIVLVVSIIVQASTIVRMFGGSWAGEAADSAAVHLSLPATT